mgnify:CR=1 FL=1
MKVLTVDYRSPDAAERFTESLRTTGFGVLTHHPIPKELVQSIYDNWYRFFMSEQKQAFLFNRETQDGYFPPSVSEVAKGNLAVNLPPILSHHDKVYTDPVPQALVLTAIVISFGMTAVLVMMSLGSFIEAGDDRINLDEEDAQ